MNNPTSSTAGQSFAVPGRLTAQQETVIRRALDELSISLAACRLAVETASSAPNRVPESTPTAEILADWQAHNLVVDKVVDDGFYTVRHVVDTIKAALNLD